jgi:DNA polymerase-1
MFSFYTAARKLLNSYILGTLENIDYDTGKLHGWFKQLGARSTGRYSSNVQQMPKDEKLARLGLQDTSIRACLEAAPDNDLLIADFQGIELVILADRSGDEILGQIIIDSGNGTDDMHLYVTRNTLTVIHKDAEKATLTNYQSGKIKTLKPLRQGSKRVSYAIAYGVTGVSLSEQLSIDLAALGVKVTRAQADDIITYWKQKAFPKAGAWLDSMSKHALMHGWTSSVLGRKRWYDLEYAALHKWRKFGIMREASNQGIQSTSADMTKLAMLYAYRELDHTRGNIVLSVHDELVLEAHRTYTEEAAEILQNSMEKAARDLLPMMGNAVKVTVNVSSCYNK